MAKKPLWKRLKYKNIAVMLAVILLIVLAISAACSNKSDDKDKEKDSSSSQSDKNDKNDSSKPDDSSKDDSSESENSEPEVEFSTETFGKDYKYVTLSNEESLISGDLILINADYGYKGEKPEDLVSSYDYMYNADDKKVMSIKSSEVEAKEKVLEALNKMISDFYAETGLKDIMLVSGYRTEEYQKTLYEKDLASTGLAYSTKVETPGHSEHHSGYALDFQLDQENYPYFTGEGEYKWIVDNCYKYGFIRRYETEKTGITGIDGETWHYRYVGVPHAQLIYKSEFCFEEYIESIKNHSRENPMYVDIAENGDRYAVYYVKADAESETTNVDIPLRDDGTEYEYTISGNNFDGYIVTVYINVKKAPVSDDSSLNQ